MNPNLFQSGIMGKHGSKSVLDHTTRNTSPSGVRNRHNP